MQSLSQTGRLEVGRFPLRILQREETAAALARCRPLPGLSRLAPYLTAQQLKDMYHKFTSVDSTEFRSVEQMQTEHEVFRIEETSFIDTLADDIAIDSAQFPTFMMEPQRPDEHLRQLQDKASQTEISHIKTGKRRGWRKLLSAGSFIKRASKKNLDQSSLKIKTNFDLPVTPTDCSGRWIPSGQIELGSSLPSPLPSLSYEDQRGMKSPSLKVTLESLHSRTNRSDREVSRFSLLFRN